MKKISKRSFRASVFHVLTNEWWEISCCWSKSTDTIETAIFIATHLKKNIYLGLGLLKESLGGHVLPLSYFHFFLKIQPWAHSVVVRQGRRGHGSPPGSRIFKKDLFFWGGEGKNTALKTWGIPMRGGEPWDHHKWFFRKCLKFSNKSIIKLILDDKNIFFQNPSVILISMVGVDVFTESSKVFSWYMLYQMLYQTLFWVFILLDTLFVAFYLS